MCYEFGMHGRYPTGPSHRPTKVVGLDYLRNANPDSTTHQSSYSANPS
jgi:hypothetical protein